MLKDNTIRDRLGIAIVGLTSYAVEQIIPAMAKAHNVYLAGLVSDRLSEAIQLAKKYKIQKKNIYNYKNFDEIVHNSDIDIVYVILPVAFHKEFVIRAAYAGKHVICEKPMATNSDDCLEMIAACEKSNRMLAIGYRMHYEPRHQYIMNLEEKGFGKLISFESAFGCVYGGDAKSWRLNKSIAGGGALMDLGIYTIQAARYTTGLEPVAVTAKEEKLKPELFSEVDETVFFDLEFPNGFIAHCKTSFNTLYSYIYIKTEKGDIKIEPAFLYSGINGVTPNGAMNFRQVTQQALQMDDFANCIYNNKKSRVSGEEGLKDIKIIEGIYRSLESGNQEFLQ
ncbi:Gfo/Idh/MocA family oxidoreductase [Mucilaginibacter puniceus]